MQGLPMNLELIQEIESLKEDNKSYTEIAEITGLTRTSIVLSLRLSKIFQTVYTQTITSLEKELELCKLNLDKSQTLITMQKREFTSLQELLDDKDTPAKISAMKNELSNLKNELEKEKKEVDMLTRKLHYKNSYLNNLSLFDKLKLLFN